MDMPSELTALNITPRGALLRWNPPLSIVDNYVLTLTHSQGKGVRTGCGEPDFLSGKTTPVNFTSNAQNKFKEDHHVDLLPYYNLTPGVHEDLIYYLFTVVDINLKN